MPYDLDPHLQISTVPASLLSRPNYDRDDLKALRISGPYSSLRLGRQAVTYDPLSIVQYCWRYSHDGTSSRLVSKRQSPSISVDPSKRQCWTIILEVDGSFCLDGVRVARVGSHVSEKGVFTYIPFYI